MGKLRQPRKPVVYPDDDGLPMADNTRQFDWIMLLATNLDILFGKRDDVFTGGNLLWYPVEGSPKVRRAPDAFVVLGRPPGYHGSYKQWEEDGVPMTVVFEIRSPGHSRSLEWAEILGFQRIRMARCFLVSQEFDEKYRKCENRSTL